jgi:hypothetical protein
MMFENLTGLQYLHAEIACKHDKAYEKATWADRLAHFNTLDFQNPKTFTKASNPIGLRAAVLALEATKRGEPSGYMVSLDACSSGLQILSLLVSCPKSFSLCGGVSDQCVDSYTTIYDSMNLHGALTRKQVKQAIMTSLYGSVSTPEAVFGVNVDFFYETMETMAPGAWDLNLGLQELWHMINGSAYEWVLPDNFHACIETKTKILHPFSFMGKDHALPVKVDGRPEFHKGLGPNLIHSIDGMIVREMYRRCMYDPKTVQRVREACYEQVHGSHGKSAQMVMTLWDQYKETGFLSVRILDYLYQDTMDLVNEKTIIALLDSLPSKPFELVSVHDCFRCHPNYGNDLRRQYNIIMADINDSTLLASMACQVADKKIKIKKHGKIDRKTILTANYMLA